MHSANTPRPDRKITPFEWAYLAAARHFAPFAIQLRIDFDTLPAPFELQQALALASEANPGARLVMWRGRWIDSGLAPAVREVEATTPFSLSYPGLLAGFAHDDRPPVEVLRWPGCGLIFRCSHALMDASGLLFFAREVFRALRGEPLLGSVANISDHAYLKDRRHPARRPALRPDRASPLGPPTRRSDGFVRALRFIPGRVPAVSARLAALLGSMRSGLESRIMLPVDLRRTDPGLRATANLSNALFLDLPPEPSWEDCYQDIVASLRRRDQHAISALDDWLPAIPLSVLGQFFAWMHGRQVRRDAYLYSATISHVGEVALRDLSAPGCAAHATGFLPFDAPGSAITLDTIQHDHGLEIAASCPAASGGEGRLSALLDTLCEALSRAAVVDEAAPGQRIEALSGACIPLPATTAYALFAEQARLHPERTALSEDGLKLSYADLERQAAVCADRLRRRGVGRGEKVALMAGRRAEVVIAVLGILHLGATFVPIDPDWPAERIHFVLADCAPACLLADEANASLAGFDRSMSLSSLLEPGDTGQPHAAVPSPDPAYLLYTSGSTGKPKGVLVGQRSLLNYILWARGAYLDEMAEPAVFPFFTSLAFDLTLTSIFVPLSSGGEVRIFAQRDVLSAIRAIVADPTLNAVKLTPSHLRLFAEFGIQAGGLRTFIVGGEALPTALAAEIVGQAGGRAAIFNEYGPTEATVGCVVHRFDPVRDTNAFVPIGHPIANTEVLLLDPKGQAVAPSEPGEIHLAGDCLALGYLARPTEDRRFAPHPGRPGERAYRTGDRALRRPDGSLDYLGRLDEQVKISGHRVEIGEVEAAIETSGLCVASAVMAEETPSGTRLAAYVHWRDGAGEQALRRALEASLPGWMRLSRIVALEAIPLNANGKVDKPRLAREHGASPPRAADPGADITEAVRAIVGELTGLPAAAIAADRSLLEQGLDSLQMVMLLTRTASRFLPERAKDALFDDLETFLRDPTLNSLVRDLLGRTPHPEEGKRHASLA